MPKNKRKIIAIYFVLFGCAFGVLVAHVINSGWDAERDKTLLISFVALTLGLASAGISLFFHKADME